MHHSRDFSAWASPDAALDSNVDLLVNWYGIELFIGTPASFFDNTAGDQLSLKPALSSPFAYATSMAWVDTGSAALSKRQYFILPPEMLGHVLILLAGSPELGTLFPVTTVPFTDLSGHSGVNQASGATEASALAEPGQDYRLIDLTTNQKSPVKANFLLEGWTPNDLHLLLREVTIKLPLMDAGRQFIVRSGGASNQTVTAPPVHEAEQLPTLHVSVLRQQTFTIVRLDDAASASAVAADGVTMFDFSTALPFDPHPTPLPFSTQTVHFPAGVNHTGIVGYTNDGSPIPVTSDQPPGGQLSGWTDFGGLGTPVPSSTAMRAIRPSLI